MTNKIEPEEFLLTVIKYIHGEINLNQAKSFLDHEAIRAVGRLLPPL